MEAREARQSGWLGRSTVRSLRPGNCFDLVGLPANPSAEHRYAATDITHLGINNLSSEQIASVDCVNGFFDGRIAPHLHSALTPEQRRDFFSVAEQWWVIAPNYQWLSLECQFSDEDQFSGPLEPDPFVWTEFPLR